MDVRHNWLTWLYYSAYVEYHSTKKNCLFRLGKTSTLCFAVWNTNSGFSSKVKTNIYICADIDMNTTKKTCSDTPSQFPSWYPEIYQRVFHISLAMFFDCSREVNKQSRYLKEMMFSFLTLQLFNKPF